MLMKRGFSTESLMRIAANTKKAQEYELSDEDLVELDEYGSPVDQGTRNLELLEQQESQMTPTDKELSNWAKPVSKQDTSIEAPDEQAKFTENIAWFLPENENEAKTLAMTAWPNVERYGNAFSDPFWAAINYWETRGDVPVTVENINEAISVGMKAAEGNKSQEITQEIGSGVPPLDTLPSNLMF